MSHVLWFSSPDLVPVFQSFLQPSPFSVLAADKPITPLTSYFHFLFASISSLSLLHSMSLLLVFIHHCFPWDIGLFYFSVLLHCLLILRGFLFGTLHLHVVSHSIHIIIWTTSLNHHFEGTLTMYHYLIGDVSLVDRGSSQHHQRKKKVTS